MKQILFQWVWHRIEVKEQRGGKEWQCNLYIIILQNGSELESLNVGHSQKIGKIDDRTDSPHCGW